MSDVRRPVGPRLLLLALVAALLGLVATTTPVLAADGDPGITPRRSERGSQDLVRLPARCLEGDDIVPQKPLQCRLSRPIKGAPTIVLWGDSHAWQMVPALLRAAKGKRVNVVAYILGACPPMDPAFKNANQRRHAIACLKSGDLVLKYLKRKKRDKQKVQLVIGAAWQLYHGNLHPNPRWGGPRAQYIKDLARLAVTRQPRLFRTLGRMRVPTDVISQMPWVPGNAAPCAKGIDPYRCWLPRAGALVSEGANARYVSKLMRSLKAPHRLIKPSTNSCGKARCQSVMGNRDVYWDYLHVSAGYSDRLWRFFRPSVQSALR